MVSLIHENCLKYFVLIPESFSFMIYSPFSSPCQTVKTPTKFRNNQFAKTKRGTVR